MQDVKLCSHQSDIRVKLVGYAVENNSYQKKFKYHNSGYYPLFCLLFKTGLFGVWVLSSSTDGKLSVGPNR
jgi:hypothetical protein